MNDFKEPQLAPNVVMPNRDFFIGVMFGFTAARKRLEEDPQPLYANKEATNEDTYLGSWLELTCAKCGRLHIFDNPNEILPNNYECQTEDCDNIIIFYGILESNLWRVGDITFEG